MFGKIECAGFLENSCDDGPGVRSVLFLQGCSKNCKGCQNTKIKEHGKGTRMEIEQLVDYLNQKCRNKKITISGGEPLEQMESLISLVKQLKNHGYNICVYTGWELELVPRTLIQLLDYIKTGDFKNALRDPQIQYVGSSNQRMFRVEQGNLYEMNLTV